MLPLIPALTCMLAGMAFAWLVARHLHRRSRAAARRSAKQFAHAVRAYVESDAGAEPRAVARAALSDTAQALDAATFWTALESLDPPLRRRRLGAALRGPRGRELGRLLARLPHVAEERHALQGDSPWRRELAARRLGLVPAPATRRALWRLLESDVEAERVAAIRALARHRFGRALEWMLAHPPAFVRRSPKARAGLLLGFGRGALTPLARALERGTGDAAMDRAAIECVGVLGARTARCAADPGRRAHARDARFAIERRLSSADFETRVAAARALGRLEAEDCSKSLLGSLADPEWQVRALAAWSLGRMRASIGLIALPARLTDPAWWVRRHAAWALSRLGEDGREELRRIAGGSPDPYARDMAREALEGRLGA